MRIVYVAGYGIISLVKLRLLSYTEKHFLVSGLHTDMTTGHAQEALNLFEKGYNCSQSVFSVYAEKLGLDLEIARRIASGFGGGIGRSGNMCGAVSGAIMAIGLTRGLHLEKDPQWREKIYALDQEFLRRFIDRFESIKCPDLLGYNLALPEEREEAKKTGAIQKVCPVMIAGAVEILDELLSSS